MKTTVPQRSAAMDVIRCLAFWCVVSVHFFVYTGFYHTLVLGSRMYLFMLIRSASMSCIPLFLMLSGYFMKNKTPTRQYYGKLIRTVSLYFLASGCCYLYSYRLSGSFLSFLLETLNYRASFYAWYMEMYFGLFLLIPYVNTLYNGLPDDRSRRGLIVTLMLLTAATGVTNCFQFSPESGWQIAYEGAESQILLPGWWQKLYPLTYYFLGAYLKDHPLKLSRIKNVLLLLLAVICNGTVNYFFNYGKEFFHGPWQDWGSILNLVQSVLLFNLLAGMEFKCLSGRPAKLLSRISELTLSAFLVSCIFDNIVYSALTRHQPVTAYQLLWYPVTTALVFAGSLFLAWILEKLYQFLSCAVRAVGSRIPAQ